MTNSAPFCTRPGNKITEINESVSRSQRATSRSIEAIDAGLTNFSSGSSLYATSEKDWQRASSSRHRLPEMRRSDTAQRDAASVPDAGVSESVDYWPAMWKLIGPLVSISDNHPHCDRWLINEILSEWLASVLLKRYCYLIVMDQKANCQRYPENIRQEKQETTDARRSS